MQIKEPEVLNLSAIRDRIFKEIFYDEKNKDLLISVIETCLGIKIQDVEYLNTELPQGNYKIKGKTMDILLDTDKGKINVELNAQKTHYTNARNFSYVCNVYIRNTLVGEDYLEDIDVIQINLSYGLDASEEIYEEYHVMNKKGEKFISNLIIYEFNMDKIINFWYARNEEMIKRYKYLIMLGLNSIELEELARKDKRVAEYMKTLDKVTVSIGINDWIDEETDQRMIRNTIKKQARKEGLAEGRQEGRQEGLAEGIIEGKKETKKDIVIKLSERDMSADEIAEICEISVDEINNIICSKNDKK